MIRIIQRKLNGKLKLVESFNGISELTRKYSEHQIKRLFSTSHEDWVREWVTMLSETKYEHRSFVKNRAKVAYRDDDVILSPSKLIGDVRAYRASLKRHPHIWPKRAYGHSRSPRTTQEKRHFDPQFTRAKRSPRALPDKYWDLYTSNEKCWKKQRKVQWKGCVSSPPPMTQEEIVDFYTPDHWYLFGEDYE